MSYSGFQGVDEGYLWWIYRTSGGFILDRYGFILDWDGFILDCHGSIRIHTGFRGIHTGCIGVRVDLCGFVVGLLWSLIHSGLTWIYRL